MNPGSLIFLAVVVLLVLAVAWTAYGRSSRRSAISPSTTSDQSAPGADAPSEADHDRSERRPADFGTR